MQDNPDEKKKSIIRAEQLAVRKAEQEFEAAVKDIKLLEQETCRSLLAAGENLKRQVKETRGKDEKATLKQAIKEAESAGRQAISRAKKNAETQIRIASEQKKESIRQAKTEKKQALKDLMAKEGTLPSSADKPEVVPSGNNYSAPGARIDIDIPELARKPETNEIQEQILKETTQTGRRFSGYEDIFRSLEEISRKLEESRRARSETHAESSENTTAADISRVQPPIDNREATADVLDEGVAESAQPESTLQEESATVSNPTDERVVQLESGKAELFEGRVRILLQNPSSAAIKTFAERLKHIDDVKMLLFSGSADEGVQIVVMVLKPIPLGEKIEQTGQVQIVSATPNEMTVRFKTG